MEETTNFGSELTMHLNNQATQPLPGSILDHQGADLDAALSWASKVTEAIKVPIEVRPFAGFGA